MPMLSAAVNFPPQLTLTAGDGHRQSYYEPVADQAQAHPSDAPASLEQAIERYNAAWNDHDVEAIMEMHAPDMVFHNHTAGERAQGDEVRGHLESIFGTWPDIRFETRRLYVRDGLVVQEWTASATHTSTMRRGEIVAEPTGARVTWDGMDVIPFEDGLVKRKDVYSDSVSIMRQLGLL
jgi:steroid delta-isomerase-like uncharacterized protein